MLKLSQRMEGQVRLGIRVPGSLPGTSSLLSKMMLIFLGIGSSPKSEYGPPYLGRSSVKFNTTVIVLEALHERVRHKSSTLLCPNPIITIRGTVATYYILKRSLEI